MRTMPARLLSIGLFLFCASLCAAADVNLASSPQAGVTSHPASSDNRSLTLLVLPFENESRMANLDWLGEGLSELTSERLLDRGVSVLSRQDRLATLEKMGLPDTTRLSHATIVKIATEADADVVVYGRFVSDGKTVTLEAHVLHVSPPSLSSALAQSTDMAGLLRAHARLSLQILCSIDERNCVAERASADSSGFSEPPPSLRLDALENFIRGVTAMDDEARLRFLREASRLEPDWDRPPFELGQIYFERRDCETALPWFSRVPPVRPDGPEASFDAGVCQLQRNDPARADAAFSGLIERARSTDSKDQLPEFPEVHNNLGVARLRLGKWSEAAAEFERATALDSEEPNYWLNLGIARLAGKQAAAAVAPLEQARNLEPEDKDARALLISTLESVGRSSDASAIQAEAADGAGRATGPNVQDSVALAKLARVSRKFDRALLRAISEGSDKGTSAHSPRKAGAGRGVR
jgi:Flp pilus assembly protein TadD/TolB-like protein